MIRAIYRNLKVNTFQPTFKLSNFRNWLLQKFLLLIFHLSWICADSAFPVPLKTRKKSKHSSRSGYGVIWEIARVKQGSALQLSGWVTACVMPKLALVWPWFSYF